MSTDAQPRYQNHGPFFAALKSRAEAHFAARGHAANQSRQIIVKAAILLSWFAGSWAALTFTASTWWQAGLWSVSLGLAMASIGFNVMHDGNHGGFSQSRALNRAMGFMLDVLGGSSYIWSWKHNVFHHTNPNIAGLDEDIDLVPVCRLSPRQPRYPWHRFQHLYIWVLYGLLAVKWHFIDDYRNLVMGHIGKQTFPRPRGWALAGVVLGKALFLGWAFVIPSLLHPIGQVLVCYLVVAVVLGFTLAVTFQTAHCVEGVSFPAKSDGRLPVDWARHQVQSAVSFGPDNPVLTWFVGGLNFQTEHHLFPRTCHVFLRELSPIVQETCREFGVNYQMLPTGRAALRSHYRWLRQMGRPVTVELDAVPASPLAATSPSRP